MSGQPYQAGYPDIEIGDWIYDLHWQFFSKLEMQKANVAKSFIEAKYRAMTSVYCEIIWLNNYQVILEKSQKFQQGSIVIISLSFIYVEIQFFMNIHNTLKRIVALCMKRIQQELLNQYTFQLSFNWQACLPKHFNLNDFICCQAS